MTDNDTQRNPEIRQLQNRKQDNGPWFVLICSVCGLIDHGSARPSLEQSGMQHTDENTMGQKSHDVRTEKIVSRDGKKLKVEVDD